MMNRTLPVGNMRRQVFIAHSLALPTVTVAVQQSTSLVTQAGWIRSADGKGPFRLSCLLKKIWCNAGWTFHLTSARQGLLFVAIDSKVLNVIENGGNLLVNKLPIIIKRKRRHGHEPVIEFSPIRIPTRLRLCSPGKCWQNFPRCFPQLLRGGNKTHLVRKSVTLTMMPTEVSWGTTNSIHYLPTNSPVISKFLPSKMDTPQTQKKIALA